VARPQKPVVAKVACLAEFAQGLRALRESAGKPTLEELSQRAHYSVSVLSEAASGKRLPTLGVTRAYVRALGGDVGEWTSRWQCVDAQLSGAPAAAAETEPAGGAPQRVEVAPQEEPAAAARETGRAGRADMRHFKAVAVFIVLLSTLGLGWAAIGAAAAPRTPAAFASGGPSAYPAIATSHTGIVVWATPGAGASAIAPIPFGTMVEVLCWRLDPAFGPGARYYLLAAPAEWVGLYAAADQFADAPHGGGISQTDSPIPKCSPGPRIGT
jgi:hypothetical protein